MLLTYYMWIKAVKSGSIYWSSMCALAYFYMVSMALLSLQTTRVMHPSHWCVFTSGVLLGRLCLPH